MDCRPLALIVPGLLTSAVAWAEEPATPPAVSFTPSIQERARAEVFADKTFSDELTDYWQVGNRARIGLAASFGAQVSGFVQAQDVRTWGSEYNASSLGEGTLTDYSADGLDMHQGWGQLASADGSLTLRIGRQEIAWHGQRLIGSVLWAHQGRSFDAARLQLKKEKLGAEVFYAKLLERPVNGDDSSGIKKDAHLVALRAGPRMGDSLNLDLLAINRIDQAAGGFLTTAGAHGKGKSGNFAWEAEGYAQFGSGDAASYLAWMAGLRAGLNIGKPYLGLGFDYLSGDDDPADDQVKVFDTLYATNHKFYGHFDAYLNIPAHTVGEGIIDGMVQTRFALTEKWKLKLDGHMFMSAAPAGEAFHGVEFDLNTAYKPVEVFTLSGGAWLYVPGAYWGADASPQLAAYLMTDFQF